VDHVDPERAQRESPYRSTIAQVLNLSLLSRFMGEAMRSEAVFVGRQLRLQSRSLSFSGSRRLEHSSAIYSSIAEDYLTRLNNL